MATGENVSAERMDLYYQALVDLPAERVTEALESLLFTAKWFPKIPEIRELIEGNPEELREAEGEAAWQAVLEYANGWHPDIGLMSDATIRRLTNRQDIALRACGGLYRLWAEQSGGPGLPFMHKDFLKAYRVSEHVEDFLLSDGDERRALNSGESGLQRLMGDPGSPDDSGLVDEVADDLEPASA